MTFTQALSNETTYNLIIQIEELLETDCPVLIEIRTSLIEELKTLGYNYTL
ncbi:hypothetical protein NVP2117O_51 [Vibrio phage 2.117.O._10N.261.45.E9]|nr:hypothetical protein NVP1117O_51 [Vibrio phage 1.117.O._10N.261.45.E9]AUR95452.1 hypothetical protein NVP1207B_45 [Vibrio phage 1.207.B._10N.222.51.C2]AUS02343.1 hypothetical protein NVP2117O_51 [Vibrio phage 2.117.O._10N.261.45.E9]